MRYFYIVLLLVAGCATNPLANQNYNERTWGIKDDVVRTYEPIGAKAYKFENADLVIEYKPDTSDSGTMFDFKNKTPKVLKVIWDESTYIAPTGKVSKIFKSGVKIIDRGQSIPPTVLPPSASYSDLVIPIENVQWGPYNQWVYSPLCGSVDRFSRGSTYKLSDDECVGNTFTYFFTYEIDGKKKNVTVKFKYASKQKPQAS